MSNIKFQNALARKEQKTPPIWFMRQAGRYHNHYQKLKEKHSFMELCKEPELASEVAMGPIEDFDFDVSIMFSDLLFPLEALGMGLYYDPGPKFEEPLTPDKMNSVRSLEEALPHLAFQKKAMELTREKLPKEKSLIGFVGGPWTLFSYATQGAHDGNLIGPKTQLPFFKIFCEVMIPLLVKNIQLQLDGGAEIVMIFDTAAGELSPFVYNQFVAPELKKLSQAHPNKLGYYSKGTQLAHMEPSLFLDSNWAGYGVDHRWDLAQTLKRKTHGFLQGNFDQALLFSSESDFKSRLQEYIRPLKEMPEGERTGWVCGLGHGVLPKTPERHVKLFVETIRKEFS